MAKIKLRNIIFMQKSFFNDYDLSLTQFPPRKLEIFLWVLAERFNFLLILPRNNVCKVSISVFYSSVLANKPRGQVNEDRLP